MGIQGPGGEEEGAMAAEVPAEVETPVAFVPQYLPATIEVGIPPSILHGNVFPPVEHDVESSPDPFTNDRIATISSPTLSISTVSDLTPTKLGEDIRGGGGKQMPTRHKMFYLKDRSVGIVCEHIIFRVHSFQTAKVLGEDIFGLPKPLLGFYHYPINPGRFSNQYRTGADRCTPTLPR